MGRMDKYQGDKATPKETVIHDAVGNGNASALDHPAFSSVRGGLKELSPRFVRMRQMVKPIDSLKVAGSCRAHHALEFTRVQAALEDYRMVAHCGSDLHGQVRAGRRFINLQRVSSSLESIPETIFGTCPRIAVARCPRSRSRLFPDP